MKNPLDLEERTRLGELFDHEAHSSFIELMNSDKLDSNEKFFRQWHVDYAMKTIVYCGAENNAVYVSRNANDIKSDLNSIVSFNPDLINLNYNSESDLVTNNWMLSLAMLQLVKNANRFVDSKKGKIDINVNETGFLSDYCEDLVYLPKNGKQEGFFVKFSVTDNGPGFPKDKPLQYWLEPKASTKKGGFGLDFVKMTCKYLNSGLGISSEQDNTKITLYHNVRLQR